MFILTKIIQISDCMHAYACLIHRFISGEYRQNETSAPEAQFICQRGFPRDKRESRVVSVRQKLLSSTDPTCPVPTAILRKIPRNINFSGTRGSERSSRNVLKATTANYAAVMRMIKDNLLKWTCERHATDCPLDRHLLRDKALELVDEHGLTDFKCSEQWLTSFLKKFSVLLNPEESIAPIFNNYRHWIDMMRSIITQYKHEDLFHMDELTMYTDVSPTGISVSTTRQEPDTSLNKMTVLLCCNASGTEKLPLLICGSYLAEIMDKDHVYSHSKDASINDDLFREWLTQLNYRMTSYDRRILLLVHRNRIDALRNLELSHVRHVFFPEDFSPMKRDVSHFIKMAYRSKYVHEEIAGAIRLEELSEIFRRRYVEGIRERRRRWNVENAVRSLVAAWWEVPRELIIASFQQTGFRRDDCFLKIRHDTWKNLETGVSLGKFVTFDDHLSADTSHKERASIGKRPSYNFRIRKVVRFSDQLNFTIYSKGRSPIVDPAQANGNLRKIYVEKDVNWRGKNPLKRSHDEARLDEDLYEEAKPSDEATSARPPKVINIQTFKSIARGSKSGDECSTTQASVNVSRTDAGYDRERDKTIDNEESCKNSRVLSNEPSIGFPEVVGNAYDGDITSQQVFDNTSAVNSDTEETTNARVISRATPKDEIESADLDGNVGCFPRKWLKRRLTEKSGNNSNNDEPKQKRSRTDSIKRCEMAFVCGPSDLARTVTTVFADALSDNSVPRLRRSCETERSIFTIRSPGGIRDKFNSSLQERRWILGESKIDEGLCALSYRIVYTH
ncbi:LOW QUALITY PROTEIN: uncharacterized protein LOC105833670 [Monomorium pharaonis]|uniref:LOW QUALITY PROTEIN: uncharacterized protein LOC105833670 n=1 Tax=Monomorium pharaonis TaxID=307658 RepID=UPI001746ACD9|nr:LOW QUALITY PROTEIN: uncharacterized protein LOC105833670 [Monomorium pharaonis]